MKKTGIACLAVAMAAALWAGSALAKATDTKAGLRLRLSCNGTETANDTRAAKKFKEIIEEKTDGKITVDIFPNDQLAGGNMSKGLEMLASGVVDLDIHSTGVIGNLDNRLLVSTLPWTFRDYAEAKEVFYGTGGAFMDEILQEKGIYYLGAVHNGLKQITNGQHPIAKPEDLKGLKMRIPGGDLFNAFYKAFGASPQAMSWSEVFTALQQGTIDGHENSLSTINSGNVQEVQKYISISNHIYEAFVFMANMERFDALDEETQQLIRDCVKEATLQVDEELERAEPDLIRKFEEENGCEIYHFTEEDTQTFKNVVQPVIDEYKEIYGVEACEAFGIE